MKLWLIKWRLLLGTLLLLGLLLWQSPPEQLQDVLADKAPRAKAFPLSYMLDTKIIKYAIDGSPAYQLETIQFAYYEGQGPTAKDRRASAYATLEKPLITLYSKGGSPWQVSAASGKSRNEGELVTLMGDVRLWQREDGVITTELTTQSLTIKPEEAFAQTRKPVIARGISGTTRATGVKLFITSGRVEFLSQVRGIYDRP